MKDLEEFARAKKSGHEFEYMFAREWQPLEVPIALDVLIGRIEMGAIRIKPNKTYYRAYKDEFGYQVLSRSNKPYKDISEWKGCELIKDFEIEETPTVTEETIELFEFEDTEIQNNIIWTRNPNPLRGYRRTDSAPLVINGEGE